MLEIKQVTDKKGLRAFIKFRYDLYRNDPHDVPYLFCDEMFTLSKDKNASFECCEAEYFMAYRDGKPVGRIAGIINHKANEQWNCRSVRFGWFDFVDDMEVSELLLTTVKEWGRSKGMTNIIGPMGFTDTDREGMLIEGFEEYGTAYAGYNYPYYATHMERLGGYVKDNDYVQCRVRIPDTVPEKFAKVAAMTSRRYNLRTRRVTRREMMSGGWGREIFRVLNITYHDLYGFSVMSEKKVDQLVKQYMRIADLNLISIVVDGNADDRIVGFGVTFPSLTDVMRKLHNGRLFPFGWLRLLHAIKRHTSDTVDMLLIGVLPEYRAKGANALIFNDLIQQYARYGFKWAEAMPQMETNEHVLGQWQYLDTRMHRRLRCYKGDI